MERSTCITCHKKRIRSKMLQFGQHWLCRSCVDSQSAGAGNILPGQSADHHAAERAAEPKIKVLNLYAGVGGNRWLWPSCLDVTAVE